MTDIVRRQLGNLTPDRLVCIRDALAAMKATFPTGFSIGTACSGSDVIMHIVDVLRKVWMDMFGVDLLIRHTFSVECVDFKQTWIKEHFSPEFLFENVESLSEGLCRDVLSGEMRPTPTCCCFACGIECDSVSGLNLHSRENRACVSSGEGRTGRTAKAALSYLQSRRPLLAIFENVRNLNVGSKSSGSAGSNLDHLRQSLNQLGYILWDGLLGADAYGMPQRRDRYYMCAFLVSRQPIQQTSEDFRPPAWFYKVGCYLSDLRIDALPLERFWLPKGSSNVLCPEARESTSGASGPSKKGGETSAVWETDHLQAWSV